MVFPEKVHKNQVVFPCDHTLPVKSVAPRGVPVAMCSGVPWERQASGAGSTWFREAGGAHTGWGHNWLAANLLPLATIITQPPHWLSAQVLITVSHWYSQEMPIAHPWGWVMCISCEFKNCHWPPSPHSYLIGCQHRYSSQSASDNHKRCP